MNALSTGGSSSVGAGLVRGPAGQDSQRTHLENISAEAVRGILRTNKMCRGNPLSALRKQPFALAESCWCSSSGSRGSWLALKDEPEELEQQLWGKSASLGLRQSLILFAFILPSPTSPMHTANDCNHVLHLRRQCSG